MSVNKVIILGRLGKNPELRYTTNGTAVCRFSVATSENYVNNNGEKVENTEWHRIVVWNKLAEHANNYLVKGSQVYLEGKLKTTSYDKEGQKHWATDVHVNTLRFIGGKPSGSEENSDQNQGPNPNPNQGQSQNQNKPAAQNRNQNKPASNQGPPDDSSFDNFGGNPGDDDIPF